MALAACGGGGGDGAGVDARQRMCWTGGGTPSDDVEVVLGTGITTFEPLVEEGTVIMHAGTQGGAHFELNARMRGLTAGDPDDSSVPAPHTLFRAFNQEGARLTPAECTFPTAYRDISAELGPGWHQLEYGTVLILGAEYFPTLDGERIRIQVEVQDPSGRYALVERWVHVDYVGLDEVDAGVPDAGTDMDAGILDAAAP